MPALPYANYLFDLDGTLIDSVALILESFHHTRKVHFGDRLPDQYYLSTMGTPLRTVFRAMCEDAAQVEVLVRTYVEFNLDRHDGAVSAYAGVADAIRLLRKRGARLGVVTSKLRDTAIRGLVVCQLEDAFEIVIGADDVAHGKPDPEPIYRALASLGATPESTLMIGDSPHDLVAGRRAGVHTAAASWGPFASELLRREQPTHWLASPTDLTRL